ncbi:MAG TPA: MarR family transcriptional regulator [Candidatus Marinimicrobia bacterium]|nr:MarR family transcriptional regulator [Candidatus Neomarinimicrobiota bacterium]
MSSLEKCTGFLTVRTGRSMKKALDINLTENGVTSTQQHVLSVLGDEDGISLSAIGRRIFLDKPAMTGLADRMEKDGLVERKRSPEDRRVIQLLLTEKGRKVLKKCENIVNETDEQLVSVLSGDELKSFREMLVKIWKNAKSNTNNENGNE